MTPSAVDPLLEVVGSTETFPNLRIDAAIDLLALRCAPADMRLVIAALRELVASAADRSIRVRAQWILAEALRANRDNDEAWTHYREAVADGTDLQPEMRVQMVVAFAEFARSSGRASEALDPVQEAFGPAERPLAVCVAVALLLEACGELQAAVDLLLRAVDVTDTPSAGAAVLLRYLGIVYEHQGLQDQALEAFETADAWLGDHTDLKERAEAANSLANGLLGAGRLDEAVRVADRAIELAQKAEDQGQRPSVLYGALTTRGNACIESGQVRLALRYFHEALLAEAKMGDRSHESLLLNNISACYLELGEAALESKYLYWALDSARELGHKEHEAHALAAMAAVHLGREGRGLWTQALQIYDELGIQRDQALVLFGIGRTYLHAEEYEDAVFFMALAVEKADAAADLPLVAMCTHELAEAQAARGHAEAAWRGYEQSWSVSETLRRQTFSAGVQIDLSREGNLVAEHAAALTLGQLSATQTSAETSLWTARMFSMLERSRSRVLIALMGATASDVRLPQDVTHELYLRASAVQRLRELVGAYRATGSADDPALTELRAELRDATRRFEEYESAVEQSHPRVTALTSTAPVDERFLQRTLSGRTALIEYAAVGDDLVSLVHAHGAMHVVRHGELAEILDSEDALVQAVRGDVDLARVRELARDLHAALLSPIEARVGLTSVMDLCVVPEPRLFSFPIEGLLSDEGYVSERFTVSYVPSTSSLRHIPMLTNSLVPALVIADPGGQLTYSRHEAAVVQELIPEILAGGPLTGAAATKSAFFRLAPQARLIHLAAHAEFVDDAPSFSGLHLADDSGERENLEVREVLGLELPGSLTVLSGCETGLSAVSGGTELIGFMRAFLSAGAAAVLASRWPVDDIAASEYMRSFYRGLLHEGLHPAQAAQRAQTDQIRLNDYAHPRDWAPFSFFGLPPEFNASEAAQEWADRS